MSEKLKLYAPVRLDDPFGLLPKGEYPLGKGNGKTDPIILKHWYIKKMIDDGKAVVIKDVEEKPVEQKPPAGKKGKGGTPKNGITLPDTNQEDEKSDTGDSGTTTPEG